MNTRSTSCSVDKQARSACKIKNCLHRRLQPFEQTPAHNYARLPIPPRGVATIRVASSLRCNSLSNHTLILLKSSIFRDNAKADRSCVRHELLHRLIPHSISSEFAAPSQLRMNYFTVVITATVLWLVRIRPELDNDTQKEVCR